MKTVLRFVAVVFYLVAWSALGAAQYAFAPPEEMEVIVEKLDVRESPPKFTFASFFTFKYSLKQPFATLGLGKKVTGVDSTLVRDGNDYQFWIQVKYQDAGTTIQGWIFAGALDKIQNVKILRTEPPRKIGASLRRESSGLTETGFIRSAIELLIPSASAQQSSPPSAPQQVGPGAAVKPPLEVLVPLQLLYVSVFIGTLLLMYKHTKDKILTLFSSFSVLLILGFLSSEAFLAAVQILLKPSQ